MTATDEAGNISDPSTGLPITIDTTAPAQPAITQPVITTETLIINDNRPVLEGTADPGSVVQFLVGGQEIGLSSITSTEGVFIFDFTKEEETS